jgi:hypothetical protein
MRAAWRMRALGVMGAEGGLECELTGGSLLSSCW